MNETDPGPSRGGQRGRDRVWGQTLRDLRTVSGVVGYLPHLRWSCHPLQMGETGLPLPSRVSSPVDGTRSPPTLTLQLGSHSAQPVRVWLPGVAARVFARELGVPAIRPWRQFG